MIDLKNLNVAFDQLAEEKGISKEKILETIKMALAAAYKRDYGKKTQVIKAEFDLQTGKANFWQVKTVLDETMIKSEEEIATEEAEREVMGKDAPISDYGGESREARETAKEALKESEEQEGEIKKVRFNPDRHIMIVEAKKIKKDVKLGD